MNRLAELVLDTAKAIQADIPRRGLPPEEGLLPESEQVLAGSLVRGTRGYIEKIVAQINGSYENGWFDACAVMVRRLVETLIIEAFEEHGLAAKIKNSNSDFLYLSDLVDSTLSEPSWNLGRNTKSALPRLKSIGDLSAHSRRFVAHRSDIDKIVGDLRVVVQELTYLAGLK
jgi:hypothetical protein